jgi:hypothetical protein
MGIGKTGTQTRIVNGSGFLFSSLLFDGRSEPTLFYFFPPLIGIICFSKDRFGNAPLFPNFGSIPLILFLFRNPLAQSIYDDMIQEAVTRLFELSGKTKEMANGKYSENYASFWVAHNAMLAFLKTWERQKKWCKSFEELANPIREGKRLYSPDFGWMYV